MKKISIIGLGYVGLPLAVEFAKKHDVIGYDVNEEKLQSYRAGNDLTDEVGDNALKNSTLLFSSSENDLKKCDYHIIAVPTPINTDKTPNLTPIIKASEVVGRNIKKGAIIIYESTVYPGTTEEICLPILEKESGLIFGQDFTIGYSPERINPGDRVHTLTNIVKIVSGSDQRTLEKISELYESIIVAGVYKAPTIKVAEAAKVIENSQRDINIAFMNELSMVFNKMEINTNEVLKAAGTKWNFLKFQPGLVGGHCIGVDPYYFVYKAEQLGYHSQIISSGRRINDGMAKYVTTNIIKKLIKEGHKVQGAKIGVLGIAFKEDCGDVRNSKVIDIVEELNDYGVEVIVYDPLVSQKDVASEYGIEMATKEDFQNLNAVILAVPHKVFIEEFTPVTYDKFYKDFNKVLIDLKNQLNRTEYESMGYSIWSL